MEVFYCFSFRFSSAVVVTSARRFFFGYTFVANWFVCIVHAKQTSKRLHSHLQNVHVSRGLVHLHSDVVRSLSVDVLSFYWNLYVYWWVLTYVSTYNILVQLYRVPSIELVAICHQCVSYENFEHCSTQTENSEEEKTTTKNRLYSLEGIDK